MLPSPLAAQQRRQPFVRDPKNPIDEEYTKKIKEYTTEPFFTSPLVDYLPASKTVPTPKAVLGDVAGAPGKLPYAEEVYQYMRMLEKARPRVKVVTHRQDRRRPRDDRRRGRRPKRIMAKLDENRARLAKLADPRTINMDDARGRHAGRGVDADLLHHRHHPLARNRRADRADGAGLPPGGRRERRTSSTIRDNVITLITPVVEVDGRDRMVDVYNWHLAHPGQELAAARSTGASTSRTTTTATRWALTLKLTGTC